MTPLFVVHKPGKLVELYRTDGRYKVVASALVNGNVPTDLKPLATYDNLTAEAAIEALASVLARKVRRTRNGHTERSSTTESEQVQPSDLLSPKARREHRAQ